MIKDPEWACCDWPGRGIRAEKEVERLRAVNDELVTALESALADGERFKLAETIKRRMHTALARAKGDV